MTATEELRRMLDERGVEWKALNESHTVYRDWHGAKCAVIEWPHGVDAHLFDMTPEQAIEATLGRGTCRNAMPLLPSGMPHPDSWMCSECGGRMDGIILEVGDYCPNCGRKVVDG